MTDLEYPIAHMKMDACQWDTPKSWGGGVFKDKRTIKIKYDATTGDGDKIVAVSYTHLTLPTILRV